VVGGPASGSVARKIAKNLDCHYIGTKLRLFPDGEGKLTLDGAPRGCAIVVQSTHPPVDSNLVHLLSLVSKAKKTSSKVVAIVPYLCYMRQDMEFLRGEVVTSRLVATMLKAAGAAGVVTVDIHSSIAMKYFEIPIRNTSAVPHLAEYFKKLRLTRPLVVAPDLFWSKRAEEFAGMLGADHTALNKQRDRRTGSLRMLQKKAGDFSGRDVILLDDMVSSGASMVLAAEYAKSQGCARLFAACTHPVLAGSAEKDMKKAGIKTIVSSNSIPHKSNRVDVSGVLADSVTRF